MKARNAGRCIALLAMAAWSPARAGAQTVTGVVTEKASDRPIAGAAVVLLDQNGAEWDAALSDLDGRFFLSPPARGQYQIRAAALSFQTASVACVVGDAEVSQVVIRMLPSPIDLPPIGATVLGHALELEEVGFYERRRFGTGVYLSLPEIEARHPRFVSDLFLGIPGVRVVRASPGDNAMNDVLMRGATSTYLGGTCYPAIIVDGWVRRRGGKGDGEPLDAIIHPDEIAGIEIYKGPGAPGFAAAESPCGAVLIWTKR